MTAHDERLFRALREAASDGDTLLDPRWDTLARGALSEEERAALLAEVDDPELAEDAIEAFRPLDAAAEERIVAQLLGAPREAEGAAELPAGRAKPLALVPERAGPERAGATHGRRGGRAPVLVAITSALAIAAGAMLFLRGAGSGSVPGSELPAYELVVARGEQARRSTSDPPGDVLRATPGTRIEILLRPAIAASAPVEARAFLVRDGRAQLWSAPIERAGGTFRIEGAADRLLEGVPAGRYDAVLVIARPGELPDAAAVERLAPELGASKGGIERSGARIFRFAIRVGDAPPGSGP